MLCRRSGGGEGVMRQMLRMLRSIIFTRFSRRLHTGGQRQRWPVREGGRGVGTLALSTQAGGAPAPALAAGQAAELCGVALAAPSSLFSARGHSRTL